MRKVKQIPDAMNARMTKKQALIPVELIRSNELTAKAKAVLFILLSNSKGWKSHAATILGMMKERRDTVYSALKELEEAGFLIRAQLIDKKTKQMANSIWIYTDSPGQFDLGDIVRRVDKAGFAFREKTIEKLAVNGKAVYGKAVYGKAVYGKTDPKYSISNKLDIQNIRVEDKSSTNNTVATPSKDTFSSDGENEKYLKLSKKLSKIVSSKKNVKHTTNQINSWAKEMKRLTTVNGVDYARQKKVLKWYKSSIGDTYTPVVESGKSFRDKFTRLEDAMHRELNPPTPNKSENSLGYKGNFKVTKKATKI